MSYKLSNSCNSIRITCVYHGHELETVLAFFELLGPIAILGLFSYYLLNSKLTGSDWWRIIFLYTFLMAIIFLLLVEFLWQIAGREEIEINQKGIVLQHCIFGLRSSRHYDGYNINGIFITRHFNTSSAALQLFMRSRPHEFLSYKIGKVAFNYGYSALFREPNTFRFGPDLTMEEAREIVCLVHHRFPEYRYDSQRNIQTR